MREHAKKHRKVVGYIFRPWITRNGIKVWARQYGRKAWRIPIYKD